MQYSNELDKLIKEVSVISKKYEELYNKSGKGFNVFEVINVTKDEVRLHSRFLAELLNPKGRHGQEDAFLILFITQFNIKLKTRSAKISVEKHIGLKTKTDGGYLDIYVYDNNGGNFIIENKIYAKDQENQLTRYHNFKKDNIFYLTLLGNEPKESSYGKLKIHEDFKLISYRDDIKKWLIECKNSAEHLPLLREGIAHYINLIETLTGQEGNDVMNDEISKHLSLSPKILKNAVLIEKNIKATKINIQWQFWQSLKEKMLANGIQTIAKQDVTLENVKGYYEKTRLADIEYGFWVDLGTVDNKNINFIIELNNFVYYGFKVFKDDEGGLALKEENTKLRVLVSEINEAYEANNWWLGSRYTEDRLDFRLFNSDAIFNLADPDQLDQTTTKIADNIKSDIDTFKSNLEKI